ncbi:MAG: TRASH domain protein [Syntrophorhabdales bacterium]|jgi:YHS domain-containing protein
MKYLIPLILVILLIRYLLKNKKKKVAPVIKPEPEVLLQDPVCGAYVSQRRDLSLRTEDGVRYFCSKACMEKFKELKR